jgi:hypothetical protein
MATPNRLPPSEAAIKHLNKAAEIVIDERRATQVRVGVLVGIGAALVALLEILEPMRPVIDEFAKMGEELPLDTRRIRAII